MARPLRLEYRGALYHVTSRGDGQEDIYLDDEDRILALAVLEDVVRRFNWCIHARRKAEKGQVLLFAFLVLRCSYGKTSTIGISRCSLPRHLAR